MIIRIDTVNPTVELQKAMEAPVVAQYEADAAEAVATAEARKAAGPVDIAMDKWVKAEAADTGETPAIVKKRLRETGEYEKHKKLLADQINRSRKTVQERKVDITSGGEPLQGGSIASIAGTITAAVIGAIAGKNVADENDAGNNPGGGKKKNRKDQEEDDKDDLRDDLDK